MKKVQLILIALLFISCEYAPREVEILEHPAHEIGYKTCIMGDSGTGKLGQGYVAQALKEEGCDSVRITGDLVYKNGLSDENDPSFYSHFYDYYGEMIENGTPFILTLGNHDYHKNPGAWLFLNDRHENIIFPNYWYAQRYGDVCYLNLDTNITYLKEHRKWLKKTMREFKETCRFIFSIAHHPIKSSGKHGDAKFFNKWYFKKYITGKVSAHFGGHDHHLSYEGQEKGTHMYVTGAGGKLRPVKEVKLPKFAISKLGYITMTYQGDSFKVSLIGVNENSEREVLFTNTIHSNK